MRSELTQTLFLLLVGLLFSALGALGADYAALYLDTAQTITAQHTFNNTGAPFIVGSNGTNVEVSGLRAATATNLSANPANCGASQCARGISQAGVAQNCTTITSVGGNSQIPFFHGTNLNTGSTVYFAANANTNGSTDSCGSSAGAAGYLFAPVAGTISKLRCNVLGAATPGAGKSYALTVREMGVGNTALTCTISGSQTGCTDLTNSVTWVVGSCYAIESIPSGTPTALSVACTVNFLSS